ncbi:hypothetical protein TGCAST_221665 [Toxoplasma gondii CAST]|uniref:Uncharacterized protein n=1 Tax=Toxoplasma gondii CAST TaxID=943122 RepID=A0A425I7S4_TOXGO|nr:hypothetical protein TGCAST_221665 [Toxoplasma gondii CAST]
MVRSSSVSAVLLCARSSFRSPSVGREGATKAETLPETRVSQGSANSSSVSYVAKETSPVDCLQICRNSTADDGRLPSHAGAETFSTQDRTPLQSSFLTRSWIPFRHKERKVLGAERPAEGAADPNVENSVHKHLTKSTRGESFDGSLGWRSGGCRFLSKRKGKSRASSCPSVSSRSQEVAEYGRTGSGEQKNGRCAEPTNSCSPKRGREPLRLFTLTSCLIRRRQNSACRFAETENSAGNPRQASREERGAFCEGTGSRGCRCCSSGAGEVPVHPKFSSFPVPGERDSASLSPGSHTTKNRENSCPVNTAEKVKVPPFRREANTTRTPGRSDTPGAPSPHPRKNFRSAETEDRNMQVETTASQRLKTRESSVAKTILEYREEYECAPPRSEPCVKLRSTRSAVTYKQTSQLRAERKKHCVLRHQSRDRHRFPSASRPEPRTDRGGKTVFRSDTNVYTRGRHFHKASERKATDPQAPRAKREWNAKTPEHLEPLCGEKEKQKPELEVERTLAKAALRKTRAEDSQPTAKRTRELEPRVPSEFKRERETRPRSKGRKHCLSKQAQEDGERSWVSEKGPRDVCDPSTSKNHKTSSKEAQQTKQSSSECRDGTGTGVHESFKLFPHGVTCAGSVKAALSCSQHSRFPSPAEPTRNGFPRSPAYVPCDGRVDKHRNGPLSHGRTEQDKTEERNHQRVLVRRLSPSAVPPAAISRLPAQAQRLATSFLSNRDLFFSLPSCSAAVLSLEETENTGVYCVGTPASLCRLERSGWARPKTGALEEGKNKVCLEA